MNLKLRNLIIGIMAMLTGVGTSLASTQLFVTTGYAWIKFQGQTNFACTNCAAPCTNNAADPFTCKIEVIIDVPPSSKIVNAHPINCPVTVLKHNSSTPFICDPGGTVIDAQ